MTLGIYGSSGLGRELLVLARQINAVGRSWTDVVFVDDFNVKGEAGQPRKMTFDQARSEFSPESIEFCIAVGEPAIRAELFDRVCGAGYGLARLIHPGVQIVEGTSVGAGAVVCHGCFVSCGVTLGNNVLLQPGASVGHDCKIGPHSVISTFVSLAGNCTVGARSYIGMSVPVKEDTTIGDEVIVGMGSVVVRNIDSGMVALGNPARPICVNQSKRVFQK